MADFLRGEVEGLQAEPIPRKIDESVSPDLLIGWLIDADLVVAATDDRSAQRRIGQYALAAEIPAIFPAVYPRRGGGEVVVQPGYELPCFGCWDYFRRDAEQLRGVNALDLDAQHVVVMAEQICLGLLDPGSGRRNLLLNRSGPPHQVITLDRAGTPSFGTMTQRPDCPSCSVDPSSLRLEAREAWQSAREARTAGATSTIDGPQLSSRPPPATRLPSTLPPARDLIDYVLNPWVGLVASIVTLVILLLSLDHGQSPDFVQVVFGFVASCGFWMCLISLFGDG